MMAHLVSFLVFMLLAVGETFPQSPAQQKDLMLFGIVEDQRSGKPLQNVCVRIYTDSIAGDSVFTDPLGKYQTFVDLGGRHRVVYSADGHHRKVVEVDTNGDLDASALAQEWNMRIDISLLGSELELPDDLLDTPVGMAAWVPAMREFQWDQPYTERYRIRYKQAVKDAERKK